MQKSSSFIFTIVLVVSIAFILLIAVLVMFHQIRIDPVAAMIKDKKDISLLLVVHEDGSPITTQVVIAHPNTKRIALFDIPHDLGAIIPKLKRVDAIRSLFENDGIEEYRDAIAQQLDYEIDYYFSIDTSNLQCLVDLLGGLYVFIPDPVEDNENKIYLPGGRALLDGEKLLSYFTYEKMTYGSQELASRYQEVVLQFLYRFGIQYSLFQDYSRFFQRCYNSDLDRRSMESLLKFLSKIDEDSMIQQRVLGTPRRVDVEGQQVELLFPHFEGQLLKDTVRQVRQTLEAGTAIPTGGKVTIELLNGTRRNGLANRSSELFESYGFEVIAVGNAESFDYERTTIIDRQGSPERARMVADSIGATVVETAPPEEEEQVETEDDENTQEEQPMPVEIEADVTVILGSDFDGWKVKNGR